MPDGHQHMSTEEELTDLREQVKGLRRRIDELEDQPGRGEDSPESEQLFRALFDRSPIGIFIYTLEEDDRLVFRSSNPAAGRILGVNTSRLVGQTIEKAFPSIAEAGIPDRYREVCHTGTPWSSRHVEYKDEQIHDAFEVYAFQTRPGTVAALFMDVSDSHHEATRREAQRDQLDRSQRMEALGLLASGVAHDLNNVLSGVVSYPELMLDELPQDSPLRNDVEMILEAGESATAIVADLLTIARGVSSEKKPFHLNVIVGEVLGSPEVKRLHERHPGLVIETYLADTILKARCSEPHVRRSVLNLVMNGAADLEDGGHLRISTRDQYVDRPVAGYDKVEIGEYVVLRVEDDGPSLEPADLARMFEPFYAKTVMGRQGTGLDLAVVWSTVQDNDGYVDIGSSPAGTWIELYLPATRDEAPESDFPVPEEDYRGHGEQVLVVDDEPRQRIIASRMLSRLGYQPEIANSGEQAINMIRDGSFAVILLDMIMPGGMNGRETYEGVLRIRPGQKVVIASGYSLSDDVIRIQALGAGRYLRKPYSSEELGLAIRDELARTSH